MKEVEGWTDKATKRNLREGERKERLEGEEKEW